MKILDRCIINGINLFLFFREKLNDVILNALHKYIVSNTKTSFEFLSSTYYINIEFFKYLYSRTENLVLEYEKEKKPFASALRYNGHRNIKTFKALLLHTYIKLK
jgi:hypothetical protein